MKKLELTKEQKIDECVKIYQLMNPLFKKELEWYDEAKKLGIEIECPTDLYNLLFKIVLSITGLKFTENLHEYFSNVVFYADDFDDIQFKELIIEILE